MHTPDPIDRHYQFADEMMELGVEFEERTIRVPTTSFKHRLANLLNEFEQNRILLPHDLPMELQIHIHQKLQPAVSRLRLMQSLIGLFGLPGDNSNDDPDWGGNDGDDTGKPSPKSPAPMAA